MHKSKPFALVLMIILMFLSAPSEAQMVPSNVLTRVFSLRMGMETATGFTIEVDGRQYLITAKHLVTASPTSSVIEIYHEKDWLKEPFRPIAVEPSSVDIIVLALNRQISGLLPIQLGIKGVFLSQDVYFIGFPFFLSINGHSANNGFPLPLVKRGIIAAFSNGDGESFIVDGINNPGFSGGPVVLGGTNPTIIGVVSGYKAAVEPIYQQGQKSADLSVQSNTGLLVAYEIDSAIKAIRKNPIGFLVP